MTERWQNEVGKLRTVRPSDDVWARVEQGPTRSPGTGLPPRRSRIVAGVVAILVFLAVGTFAWRALRPTTSNPAGPSAATIVATFSVSHVEGGGSGPSATLRTPDGVVEGSPTSYSWKNDGGTMIADTATPTFVASDFAEIPQGSQLILDSDANAVTGGLEAGGDYPFTEVVSFGTIDGPVTLDQPIGRYVLHLVPAWDQGTVDYFFPVGIVAGGIPAAEGASLSTVGKNAPKATLTFAGESQRGVRSAYTWCDGSGQCVSGVADFASYPPVDRYLKIRAGTRIEVLGDATSFTGSYQLANDQGAGPTSFGGGAVPDEVGRYVLTIDVTFERGSATFFLGVEATETLVSPTVVPQAGHLADSHWRLVSMDGVPIAPDKQPVTLGFDADHLFGKDGCNGYGAPYRVDGASIHVGDIFMTAVLCEGGGTMDRAKVFYEGLSGATRFESSADRLRIFSPATALIFEPDTSS